MDFRIVGAMLNSALYLISVFVAGIVTNHLWSMWLAIAAMGITYLSYTVQLTAANRFGEVVTVASIAIGALAGISLLF